MHRIFRSFPVKDVPGTKVKMLNWASRFNIFCFLDDHGYAFPPHRQEVLLGAGALFQHAPATGAALSGLDDFLLRHQDWVMGHLAYDLKNEIESLTSAHADLMGFGDIGLFVPEVLMALRNSELSIGIRGDDHERVYRDLMAVPEQIPNIGVRTMGPVRHGLQPDEYLKIISALQDHIQRGDGYEVNFCMEHVAHNVDMDPLAVFAALGTISPNPFTACYRSGASYLLCASPERFLMRQGRRLHAQPIKGTAPRFHGNDALDQASVQKLVGSAKERAENVMIVDLMRNDLSRVCTEGSVQVDELFGIRSFPQVHQMVSTISGTLDPAFGFTDILRATFPMGSMTGAPKRRVMEMIESFEGFRRGLFSGSVGYIKPSGDFDFNVVIRSLLYHQPSGRLSFPTGSGITYYADAAQEYQECLWKAKAMEDALKMVRAGA
jgi:para-aminobenzoate synthetase component I